MCYTYDAYDEMVRNFTNIIVMSLLLVATTGFSVSGHFCGTNLVSVEINQEAEPCCDSEMCCHSKVQFIQLDEEYVTMHVRFDFHSSALDKVNFTEITAWNDVYNVTIEKHSFRIAESPPPRERGMRLAALQRYLL